MIPNFGQPEIALGPLTVHGFGLMVAAAVLVMIASHHSVSAGPGGASAIVTSI